MRWKGRTPRIDQRSLVFARCISTLCRTFTAWIAMPLFAVRLNHNSAPLEVRERMVFSGDTLQSSLRNLKEQLGVDEAVIVSTCNRTELYTTLNAVPDPQPVIEWLCRTRGVSSDWLMPYLYRHQGSHALSHLLRV